MKSGKVLVLLSLMLVSPLVSQAAPPAKGKAAVAMEEPSKETRAKMATMHEQMAACLKSDKKFADCHEQMRNSCPMMKDGACPMMMHHDHGMKKGAGDDHSGHSGH